MFGSMAERMGEPVQETELTRTKSRCGPTSEQCVGIILAKGGEGLDEDVIRAHGGGGGDGVTRCEEHRIGKMKMAACWVRWRQSGTGLYKVVSHLRDCLSDRATQGNCGRWKHGQDRDF